MARRVGDGTLQPRATMRPRDRKSGTVPHSHGYQRQLTKYFNRKEQLDNP